MYYWVAERTRKCMFCYLLFFKQKCQNCVSQMLEIAAFCHGKLNIFEFWTTCALHAFHHHQLGEKITVRDE